MRRKKAKELRKIAKMFAANFGQPDNWRKAYRNGKRIYVTKGRSI
jgi:hypothetical protein